VKSDKVYSVEGYNRVREHNSFPIMFRGGISFGSDVIFSPELYINDINNPDRKETYKTSLNVCGKSYVNAVNLEKTDKGPRLFCDERFVKQLTFESKKAIRVVNTEKGRFYEIMWTYIICEIFENSNKNMSNLINKLLLQRAINLYKYYKDNEKCSNHYSEFIKLSCRGFLRYVSVNGLGIVTVRNQLESKLYKLNQFDWELNNDSSEYLV